MQDKEKLKGDVKSLIEDAKLSLKRLRNESVIRDCDIFKLSYLLGDTADARGASVILAKTFPEDKEIESMRKEAIDIHSNAYRERDRFTNDCECKKRS